MVSLVETAEYTNGVDRTAPFVPLDLTLACNTSYDDISANILVNSRRALPWVQDTKPHERVAVLVGGGPSLADTVEGIRSASAAGHQIFALNGAEKWLSRHGIPVDYQVVIDSRQKNIEFVRGSWARGFYLASQCHPDLFDEIGSAAGVTLMHMAGCGVDESELQICGGITVGLSAMSLVYALGYREVHLFGYDSSDREGDGHAYAQAEDGAESKRVEVWCGGRKFVAQPALIGQARVFPQWASLFLQHGVSLHVHGSGLLPTIAEEMQRPIPEDAACYDLGKAPASWDFLCWLVRAEMEKRQRGCDKPLRVAIMPGPKDGFRDDDLPGDKAARQQMLDNVMRPAIAMIGAVEDFEAYRGHELPYSLRAVSDMARRGIDVPKFVAPKGDAAWVEGWLGGLQAPIVITLREAEHWPLRNSNIEAWLAFARARAEEGEMVIFVRDTAHCGEQHLDGFPTCPMASQHVGIRAALYARAKVNLFVCNGPMAFAMFGERPFLIFKQLSEGYPCGPDFWRESIGVEVGFQYPWARADQRLIWADDTLDEIEKAWAALTAFLEKEK